VRISQKVYLEPKWLRYLCNNRRTHEHLSSERNKKNKKKPSSGFFSWEKKSTKKKAATPNEGCDRLDLNAC